MKTFLNMNELTIHHALFFIKGCVSDRGKLDSHAVRSTPFCFGVFLPGRRERRQVSRVLPVVDVHLVGGWRVNWWRFFI